MFDGRMYMAFIAAGATPGSGSAVKACSTDKTMNWTATSILPPTGFSAPSLAVFRGRLYAAFLIRDPEGAFAMQVWSTPNENDWNWPSLVDIPARMYQAAPSLAVFNGQLYLAFLTPVGQSAMVLIYSTKDGMKWTPVDTPTDDGWLYSQSAPSLTVYQGSLYVAVGVGPKDGKLWRTPDGKTWKDSNGNPTGPTWYGPPVQSGVSLATDGERLYSACVTTNSGNAASLCWTTNGLNWTDGTSTGFTSSVTPALAATGIW